MSAPPCTLGCCVIVLSNMTQESFSLPLKHSQFWEKLPVLTYSDLGRFWTESWLCTVLYKNERKKVILPLATGIQDGSRIQPGTAWDQIS